MQVLQLMMVAKHPDSHYLIPAVGLAAVLASVVWADVERELPDRPALTNGLALAGAGLVCLVRVPPNSTWFRS